MIPLSWSLALSTVLFTIGVVGVLVRRNALVIFMSIELMLNAVSLNFMAFNRFVALDPAVGQVVVLFVDAVLRARGQRLVLSAPHTQPLFTMDKAGFLDRLGRPAFADHRLGARGKADP